MTTALAKGGNAPLPMGLCRVTLAPTRTEVDICAVLLTQEGKVRGDEDLVFFNHPSQDGVTLAGRAVEADLGAIPAAVDRVVIVASVDPQQPVAHFTAESTPQAFVECGDVRLSFAPPPFAHRESAAVLVEIYRRAGAWKVRAVGQGWDTGLAGLATDFGVVVDDDGSAPQEPAPQTRAVPGSAISLDKFERAAPGLVSLYKTARTSLEKKQVVGQRAAVYLVLDYSGSMSSFYRRGTMQHLAEQALALSAHLDDDGIVPLVFFTHEVPPVADISLDNYQGRVDALRRKLRMGGTAYAPAMRAVIDHYEASGSAEPAFVIFQTDGEPGDRGRASKLLVQSSSLPIFWKFVGFGPERGLRFLEQLDTLKGRKVDNAHFFAAGKDPAKRSDAELYDAMMEEFPQWLRAARAAGILR